MRKQFKIISIFLTAFVFVVLFASCGESHTHSFELKNDATAHWHECSCGEIQDKQEHKFGDWMIKKPATEEEVGSKIKVCSGCGYELTEEIPKKAHTHTYAKTYSSDETGHWYAATCEHTNEKKGFSDHHYGEWITTKPATETEAGSKKKVCSVCGYEHTEEVKMDLEYTLSEDKKSYIVTGIGNVTSKDIVIKDTYNSLPVTAIKHFAFYKCSSLTSIVIPDSVTSIGQAAFSGCSNLTSIIVPDSVTSIGYEVFSQCTNLTSITLPFVGEKPNGTDNTYLGYIFGGNANIDDGNSSIPSTLKEVIITGGTSIGYRAFSGCSSLESITIPDSVTSIGGSAFLGCNSLTSITLPFVGAESDGIENTHLGYIFGAPSNNDNKRYVPSTLKEVIITGGTSIRESAFENCSSLTSITIPNSVTSIENSAFYGCSSLSNVYYEGTIENWCKLNYGIFGSSTSSNSNHFYLKNSNSEWTEVTIIEIPETITEIGNSQFSEFNNVTSIIIPDSVTSIWNYAFYDCSSLTSIVIPDSVTSIGASAFLDCSSLTSITLPFVGAELNGTTNTHFGYIYGAPSNNDNKTCVPNSLKEVTITGGTSIGDGAFSGCSSLTSIIIPKSVTSIGDEAFEDCNSLVYNEYDNGYYLGNKDNPYIVLVKSKSIDITSCEIYDDTKFIHSSTFSNCGSLTSITVPNSVASIGKSAFYNCSSLTSVTIGNSVISVGDEAFDGCSSLTSIVIPNSVTSIGHGTFENCSNLTSITLPFVGAELNGTNHTYFRYIFGNAIPNSLKEVTITGGTTIESSAFSYCSSLTSVILGNGVISIGDKAFEDCNRIESIVIPNSITSIGASAFDGCYGLSDVYYEGTIENWCKLNYNIFPLTPPSSYSNHFYLRNAINEWEEVTSIEIPSTITEIGIKQFYRFNNLTSITIPDSVTSIGNAAFGDCSSLSSITIGNSVTSIGNAAFSGCSSLTSIIIPDSVTGIGRAAFSGCSNLTSITIGYGTSNIGESSFEYCSSLSNVYYEGTIENWCKLNYGIFGSLTSSNSNHFYLKNSNNEWEEVTSIEIPETITEIGNSQFSGFNNVTSIIIPESVTSIGEYAFSQCTNLTSITIPDCLTSIGEGAFERCENLNYNEYDNGYYLGNKDNPYIVLVKSKSTDITSCEININTKFIYNSAFYNCSSLIGITIPDSVTSIGQYAFYNCSSLTGITIPDSVTSIGGIAFERCENLNYNEYDNGYYLGNTDNPYVVLVKSKSTDIASCEININTKFIYQFALSSCSSLTSVTIGNSVTSIGDGAFSGCSSLTSIEIPNSVTSIGYRAFERCSSLAGITIPNSVTSIGYEAFSGCSSLASITIPDSVTSIGERAFEDCSSLTSITIGYGTTNIGEGSFKYCSSLTAIYYAGDETEWINIIGSENLDLTNVTIYYYSEIEPTEAGNYWHYVDGVITKW